MSYYNKRKKYIFNLVLFGLFSISTMKLNAQDVKFSSFKIKGVGKFIKFLKKSNNYYWIASARGLTRYNIKSKKSKLFNKQYGLPDDYVTSLAVYPNEKKIWVGTPRGLALINTEKNKVTIYNKTKKNLSNDIVQSLLLDGETLYVGTQFGVDKFEGGTWTAYTAIEGLAGNDIQSFAIEGDQIWAGGADGISVYDKNEDLWQSYGIDNNLNSPLVTSISIAADAVWVGTIGGGVSRFDKNGLVFEPITEEDGLISDEVQYLADDGDYLWVCTFNGLSRLEKKSLKIKNFPANASGITEASLVAGLIDGNQIYLGTDGGGIFTANKVVPQVSFDVAKTRYVKKNEIAIYASMFSKYGISKLKLSYKPVTSIKNDWFTTGLTTSSAKSGNRMVGKLNTAKLIDGKYLVAIEAIDDKGKSNRTTGIVIVDNIKPKVKLFMRPPEANAKKVYISGSYNELNLKSLSVKIGKRKLRANEIAINRQQKRFRFPYLIALGGLIVVSVEDIALNKISLKQNYVIDREPPKLTVAPLDEKRDIKGNEVIIHGSVVDENIDQVIINPGQIIAELILVGNNRSDFTAKASIRKEGKYTFQISAFDKAGRSATKKLSIQFYSDETIIEINEDKIPEFTLKDYVEIGGNILGPLLKEFYIIPNGKVDERIDIRIQKPKTEKKFLVKVPLKSGKNKIKVTGIHAKTGEPAEIEYEIESSQKAPQTKLDVTSRSFSKRRVVVKGTFEKGITKIIINKKKAKLDFEKLTYEKEVALKEGKNKITIQTVDELGKVRKRKEVIYFDRDAPKLTVRPLPKKTGLSDIKFKGRVKDVSGYELNVFPAARIEYSSKEKGDFEGRVALTLGINRIHFIVEDAAGNKTKKEYLVNYNPKFAKIEVGEGVVNNEELAALRREIENLKKMLSRKGKRIVFSGKIGFVKAKLPSRAGLYLVPLAGRIKSYDAAAQMYLGNKHFGDIVASFNGRSPRHLKKVLVPSPALFKLLARSRYRNTFISIVKKSGSAYMLKRSVGMVQKTILRHLIRSRRLKSVKAKKRYVLYKLKNGTAIAILKFGIISKKLIKKEKIKEILVANISKKGMIFHRLVR